MSASRQPPNTARSSRDTAREAFAIARLAKTEFRLERLIAVAAVSVALVLMLATAGASALKGNWQGAQAMLFGSGSVCTVGVTALFYMFNRSLLFVERMSKTSEKGGTNDD